MRIREMLLKITEIQMKMEKENKNKNNGYK